MAVTLAITGASGSPYAIRLLEQLLSGGETVHLLISKAAMQVMAMELSEPMPSAPEKLEQKLCEQFEVNENQLKVWGREQWSSPVASGSAAPRKMVICPCSMGTLAAIANGLSDNLIERAADVVIKERGQLLLVPRETPLSAIHLENMLKLARLGVTILPASPGFYHQPQKVDELVDFVVARILDQLGLSQQITPRWGYDSGRE